MIQKNTLLASFTLIGFTLSTHVDASSFMESPSSAPCFAIRGNGELMPSHWAALSHAIEVYGVPQAIAGGSSGSLSAFLLDSILINPVYKKLESSSRSEDQTITASYLLKTIQLIFENTANNPKFSTLIKMLSNLQSAPTQLGFTPELMNWIKNYSGNLSATDAKNLEDALKQVKNSEVFFGPGVEKAFTSVVAFNQNKSPNALNDLKLQLSILKKTASVLGKFDAEHDPALLLRPGIINFNGLAKVFGKVANFLSLRKASPSFIKQFESHISLCAKESSKLSMNEFRKTSDGMKCIEDFNSLFNRYYNEVTLNTNEERYNDPISGNQNFTSIITTAVATGSSSKIISESQKQYLLTGDDQIAEKLKINESEIKFGYWGSPSKLEQIKNTFSKSQTSWTTADKSKRFISLGDTKWITALSRSPAEPGLSSFLPLSDESSETRLSLGGWSDLHPILVLKAMGCKNTVYITRSGGDSPFSQGVAKRLFNFDDKSVPWSKLRPTDPKSQEENSKGVPDDGSLWSKMYNLGNPNSSFSQSLLNASAVVCTNWNAFNLTKSNPGELATQWNGILEDSYRAPIFERENIPHTGISEPRLLKKGQTYTSDVSGCIL